MNSINIKNKPDTITRKKAINKIGIYGKYTAITALGTYLIKSKKAQAQSPADPGEGF
jgi:hypothetical protein